MNRRTWMRCMPMVAGGLTAWRHAGAQVPLSIIMPDMGPAVPIKLPKDHGAHLSYESEWWALKGEITQAGGPSLGFHISFLRASVESAKDSKSRFAPRHVVAARASITDSDRGLLHDQRTARVGFGLTDVSEDDVGILLQDWSFKRTGPLAQSVFQARVDAQGVLMDLKATSSQPMMLHGENGYIRRERSEQDSTRYYSVPGMTLDGHVTWRDKSQAVSGRAWFDHGWGRSQLVTGAAGSDWIGIHLNDGSVLMVFRMRREDGIPVWESATLRQPGRPDRIYKHEEIKLTPQETWRSPKTGAEYPVVWKVELAGVGYQVKARLKNQEMDGGNGVGDVFWEGLSELSDMQGRVLGTGYLEMSGYLPDASTQVR